MSSLTSSSDTLTFWDTVKAADEANYLLAAGVYYTNYSSQTNNCGIVQGHAYTILSAFTMNETSGTSHKMYLIRNPWGITYYSEDWYYADSKWTDGLAAQVPLGIDPRTS